MSNELIAIITEGNTERAIIDVLLAHDALKFNRQDMLQEEIIRCRNGKRFARQFLDKSFDRKICVYRILDSRAENFNVPKAYERKISEIINLTTRPEIEILFILYHHDYQRYTNGNFAKPSIYVKDNYNDLNKVKSYQDNFDFWDQNFDMLISILKQYKSYHPNDETIADLLKD
ncbi:N-6 DNA methylase [Lactobacillus hominis]|uniref:N-6 DNA methylase n=1 Tax=Lactobacillus hominis TaxID=1203033 RepID=UPI0023F3B7AB|nr:N-6 DNA methylase [Lactobacillus hominis]